MPLAEKDEIRVVLHVHLEAPGLERGAAPHASARNEIEPGGGQVDERFPPGRIGRLRRIRILKPFRVAPRRMQKRLGETGLEFLGIARAGI